MKVVVLRRAEADIRAIGRYSFDSWSEETALNYLTGLRDVIRALASGQGRGVQTPGLPEDIRRITFQSHFIFYRRRADRVEVIRVLHRQMDFVCHLR